MRAKTTECLEFRKEWCLPPVRGWLYWQSPAAQGACQLQCSQSANECPGQRVCISGKTPAPIQWLSCWAGNIWENKKRMRHSILKNKVSHSHRKGWFGQSTTWVPLSAICTTQGEDVKLLGGPSLEVILKSEQKVNFARMRCFCCCCFLTL